MKILSILLIFWLGMGEGDKDIQKTEIKTSAVCDHCKERLDKALKEVEGLKYAFLDLKTFNLKVKYDAEIISLDEIRTLVSKIGYDADDVPANPASYDKLDGCCKKGAH
nr:putative MerP [uncultured bacterium]